MLQKLSPTLHAHAGVVTIEGHADPHGSAGKWGTDWLLAAARANSVGQYLIDDKAVDPADISFISFGSQHATAGASEGGDRAQPTRRHRAALGAGRRRRDRATAAPHGDRHDEADRRHRTQRPRRGDTTQRVALTRPRSGAPPFG